MEYIDIHTHILPRLDDGSKSIEETFSLIEELKKQGVTKILATPHFYADVADLDQTLSAAKETFLKLKEQLPADAPEIKLGYEVHYFKNISNIDEINKLTIDGTNYLLLELSFRHSCDDAVNDIIALNLNRNIVPILAHIERYAALPGFNNVLEAIKDGFAIGQINASSLTDKHLRKTALKLIEDKYGSILASDTHSLVNRPPEFTDAFKFIEKKLGADTLKRLKVYNDAFCKKIFVG